MSSSVRAGVLLDAEFYQAPDKLIEVLSPALTVDTMSVFTFNYSHGMAGITCNSSVALADNTGSYYYGPLSLRVVSKSSNSFVCELDARSIEVARFAAGTRRSGSYTFAVKNPEKLSGFVIEE
jgi:hypothetical protein